MNDYMEINKKGALLYTIIGDKYKKAAPRYIKAVIIDKLARRVKRRRSLFSRFVKSFLIFFSLSLSSNLQLQSKENLFFNKWPPFFSPQRELSGCD